ncbi:MAG: Fic family protein [Nocardioidaceae bacterium]|nr:Fic family protein [Nocardioidaceae bacterium]
MTQIEHLDLEDLLRLFRALGAGPVRDIGLLDSASARPRSSAFGQDAYPTLDVKAAALLLALARNHPLVDGDKRLTWLATVVFLDLNSCGPQLTHEAACDLVMDVAEGRLDVTQITARLRVTPRE